MAQEKSKTETLTPEVKQILLFVVVGLGLLLAVWSGYRSLRGPEMQVVGTMNGEPGKAEMMKK